MKNIFCDKCGKMLDIKLQGDKQIGICKCGCIKEIQSFNFTDRIYKPEEKAKGILDNKESSKGFPHICDKCGHTEAYIHDLGASYSDESNVYLFKCKECGYVKRQADGSSNH